MVLGVVMVTSAIESLSSVESCKTAQRQEDVESSVEPVGPWVVPLRKPHTWEPPLRHWFPSGSGTTFIYPHLPKRPKREDP